MENGDAAEDAAVRAYADPRAEDGFGVSGCIGCRSCTRACPSARSGGVRPDEVVAAVREGRAPSGLGDCLQCGRCDRACPEGVAVSALIAHLRSSSGSPAAARAAAAILSSGCAVRPSARTAAQREALGLPRPPAPGTEEARRLVGRSCIRGASCRAGSLSSRPPPGSPSRGWAPPCPSSRARRAAASPRAPGSRSPWAPASTRSPRASRC